MHALLLGLSRMMAVTGGIVLSALIALTCVSVAGRGLFTMLHGWPGALLPEGWAAAILALGIGPIMGDFELTEAGMAFAIFAFLPWCQITGGHAQVDVFTQALSPRADRILSAVIATVFAAVLALIAWQLGAGMVSKLRTGQTTFLIQFPVWWAYAPALVGAVLSSLVAFYLAVMRLREAASGQALLPPQSGPDH